jgi:hypothetical protein
MVTRNVTSMSLQSVHAYLRFKYKVYSNKMEDVNIKKNLEAQYNQKMLFLQPSPLNCKQKSDESTKWVQW